MSRWTRREWIAGTLAASAGAVGWRSAVADALADRGEQRHVILLWMTGGPSQMDTFDLKPGHENGGEFAEIETNVPGLRISEHLPGLAARADKLAIIRGTSTKEGDHGRGTYLMRTGHAPGGPVRYPTLGSLVAKALGRDDAALPNYVAVNPYRVFNRPAFQPGFLGPQYAPLTVGAADNFQQANPMADGDGYAELGVDDLASPVGDVRAATRLGLLRSLQDDFVRDHATDAPRAQNTSLERTVRMMDGTAAAAFDLEDEPAALRDRYGRGRFGQGCLMARRLVERGVPFIEVSLGQFGGGSLGWDTHRNNFENVRNLSASLDAGWSTLMDDLAERGLLERTTILWMGEFGRTPKINPGGGRDHYPKAWTTVLAGGGIAGGSVHGRTTDDGTEVADGLCNVGDVLATTCRAAGIDPATQNVSEMGRPIRISEGTPLADLLT